MKSSKLVKFVPVAALVLTAVPMFAFAALTGVTSLVDDFGKIVGKLIPILTALALVFFIVGLIRFVIAADEEKRKDGKSMMWWGIVALFVIVTIWGITGFIGESLGITEKKAQDAPVVTGIPN